MSGRIPSIETRAYGCRFRSRLEARWAVFLTEAGFHWEYEPEGAALSSGNYLCDFRVTRNDVTVWLEVKPPNNTEDDPRWAELARVSGQMVFVVRGMHRNGDRCEQAHSARVWMPDGAMADVHRLWQAKSYEAAWDRASEARFDGSDDLRHRPGQGPRRGRRRT
jgi:hypothetical protein